MARHIRHLPSPGALVEITCTTFQGRFLLRPDRTLNRRFLGVLARALQLYDVKLHAVAVLSSHYHLLISPRDTEQMARFMGHLNTNVSKEIGRLVGWSGCLFESRYSDVVVSDEPEAQIARLEYLLSQGCKEGLVSSPLEWPGVHSAAALTLGRKLVGEWIDRRAYWRARRRRQDVVPQDFAEDLTIELQPLPCWAGLSQAGRRDRVREIVERIEAITRAQHQAMGTATAGVPAVLAVDPHRRPVARQRSPKPRAHAFSRRVREEILEAYRRFVAAYREAVARLERGESGVCFPGDCFPPGLPYVAPG